MKTQQVRAPNIRDVARVAGVSYQTVSRVLNQSESIRPGTRERVLEAIDELGYRPNPAARALVPSRSRTIGVLSSQSAHYGPATSIAAIESAARAAGYRLSITSTASNAYASIKAGIDYLMSQAVEALVVVAPQAHVFEAIQDLSVSVPIVTLESTGRDVRGSLSVDQVAGARLATQHLVELGHREIVHITGPQDWIEALARTRGYREALSAAGLQVRAPVVGDWSAESGYRAGLELLGARDVTAVFAGNDQMALGLLHAARELGVDVPNELSVIGFDDIPEAAHFAPPLTTIRQNFVEIGRRAVAIILAELRGDMEVDHQMVPPELILRESTSAVRSTHT